ncbi:uncharacterized protein LOC129592363 [Paramacrobiotus metropolitanus]|uniref:uncharacterized protein LOC129592363 n=1 Tax=Paramacrobiotus metropolitanus TaxID=2943436 RepID=UPI0024463768|nr:uncharacterized protein LOC129592363 [Paramacrobiotus metropolitanus]
MTVIIGVIVAFVASACDASLLVKRASGQTPKVWDALDQLKGANRALHATEMQELLRSARPNQDYPALASIPATNIDCLKFHQPGFYADVDAGKCQVFHRCDISGNLTSYLCPNMTLFNQITLVCDWWFNVDCSQAKNFADYSNSRLYQGADVMLLDNQEVIAASGAVDAKKAAQLPAPKPAKNGNKKAKRKFRS